MCVGQAQRCRRLSRILSLDGGGIRGVFSLQILSRVEELLRRERGKPDLVLADVFDMFAGTSTGAIIATFLAWGKSVAEIEQMYIGHAPEIFCKSNFIGRWRSKYRADGITRFFRNQFSEADGTAATLGSSRLRTKLLIVMRNASTGSPWPLTNHPEACYNDRSLHDCNLDAPLWQLLRASTAAPTFFPPERILFGTQKFAFVDGGITPYCSPALIAVMMATLPPYRFCWPTGRDRLHLISIGTGSVRTRLPERVAANPNLLDQIKHVIPSLIDGTVVQQDMMCRVLGDCIFGEKIDTEVGDLAGGCLPSGEQKFTYVRYNQALDALPADWAGAEPMKVDLDDLGLIPELQRIGRRYAQTHVRAEHLYPRSVSAHPSAGGSSVLPQTAT